MDGKGIPPNNPRSTPSSSASSTTSTSVGSIIVGRNHQKAEENIDDREKKKMMKMIRDKMEKIVGRQYVKKMALWTAKNFTPILSHDQLEPIMATLGFTSAAHISTTKYSNNNTTTTSPPDPINYNTPASVPDDDHDVLWKEYYFPGGPPLVQLISTNSSESKLVPPPHPRLPYPYIDGLHALTYNAFLEAVSCYLPNSFNSSYIFVLQEMALEAGDENKEWRTMREEDGIKYVYCDPSFDSFSSPPPPTTCIKKKIISYSSSSSNTSTESNIGNKGELITPFGTFVPLDDIIIISQPPPAHDDPNHDDPPPNQIKN